ncbi:MAG TPA: sialidase family protein [Terriglobales bacterium]|nr:sialidase family protein [Terriglobales bacterium]
MSIKITDRFPTPFALLIVGLLLGGLTYAQTAIQVQEGDDEGYISATPVVAVDTSGTVAGPGSPTGTSRPPRVGTNRQVNDVQQGFPHGLFGRSETSVAASADGSLLVFGWNDAQGFCGAPFGAACTPPALPGLSGFGFSSDGGKTLIDGGAPPVINHVFSRGDPWLDRGGFDTTTFYYANLAVDDTTGASLGASVHRGHFTNGVLNWEDVQAFNAPNAPHDFYDKEAIATAKDGSGAGYVSLTNFVAVCGFDQAGAGQIEVWRTHDSGASWQGPTIVSPDQTTPNDPNNPNCGATQILQQSSAPAIGPNGEVYVAWQFGPTFTSAGTSANAAIYFARSLDGGLTFSTPQSVAAINSLRQDPPVGYNRNRINDHPRVAVATSGANKGRVYVAFYSAASPVGATLLGSCPAGTPAPNTTCIQQSLVSSQVFITYSDDLGATWSTPAPLAPAEPASGVKRFWPVVTVEPTGNVDVVYYESQEMQVNPAHVCSPRVTSLRRAGFDNSLVNTYWVQSLDGGKTFSSPTKVTTATTNWCTTVSNITPNFGDYIGSVSAGNFVIPTWADGRNGVPDVFEAPILTGKSH